MHALRLFAGLALIAVHGSVLLWTNFSEPAHAASEPVATDEKRVEIITQERALKPGGMLNVKTANGRINVTSWDKPAVKIVAKKEMRVNGGGGFLFWKSGSPFKNEAEAQAHFDQLTVNVEGDGDTLDLSVTYPPRQSGVNLSVSFELTVPASIAARLNSSNGAILVDKLAGPVTAETSNGGIDLRNILRNAKAHTSNGSVKCENMAGALEVKTSNGTINVSCPRPLAPEQTLACRTSNGSIRVGLAKESSFDLSAETSNGSINSDFPLPKGERGKPRKEVDAPVNGGGPKVSLRTSNGAIELDAI